MYAMYQIYFDTEFNGSSSIIIYYTFNLSSVFNWLSK